MKSFPLGHPLPPNTPHAVSVSLPTLADVIGYETGEPRVWEKLTQGYPRFVQHPFNKKVEEYFRQQYGWEGQIVTLLASDILLKNLFDFVGVSGEVKTENGVTAVAFADSPEVTARVKSFVQHTGAGVSSRRAEEFLLKVTMGSGTQTRRVGMKMDDESCNVLNNCETQTLRVNSALADLYGAKEQDVALTNFGMSAAYAAFCAVNKVQAPKKRTRWLQLGWLYLDTIRMLEKFSAQSFVLYDVTEKEKIEKLFSEHGGELAGVVTEVPTNPLVQTVDLPWLYALAQKYGIAVVVDSTLGTPVITDILPHVDVAVESLTKFACGQGDTVGGAAVVNPHSEFASALRSLVKETAVPIYEGDAEQLALSIQGYEARMHQISANTNKLISLLEQIPAITKIYHASAGISKENFAKIARSPDLIAGVISLEFNLPFAQVYDRLDLPKGPSFGTEFTLCMPYFYLAHYDLVGTPKGREFLAEQGINPDLLRISVGLEDPAEIAEKIRRAISQ